MLHRNISISLNTFSTVSALFLIFITVDDTTGFSSNCVDKIGFGSMFRGVLEIKLMHDMHENAISTNELISPPLDFFIQAIIYCNN